MPIERDDSIDFDPGLQGQEPLSVEGRQRTFRDGEFIQWRADTATIPESVANPRDQYLYNGINVSPQDFVIKDAYEGRTRGQIKFLDYHAMSFSEQCDYCQVSAVFGDSFCGKCIHNESSQERGKQDYSDPQVIKSAHNSTVLDMRKKLSQVREENDRLHRMVESRQQRVEELEQLTGEDEL